MIEDGKGKWVIGDIEEISRLLAARIKDIARFTPSLTRGMDFRSDEAQQYNNGLDEIVCHSNWRHPSIIEKNKQALGKLSNDVNFRNMVEKTNCSSV